MKKVKVKSYTVKAHTRKARKKSSTATAGNKKAVSSWLMKDKPKDKIVYVPSEKVIRVYMSGDIVRAFGNVSEKDATINHPPLKRWLKVNRYSGPMRVQKTARKKKATTTAKKRATSTVKKKTTASSKVSKLKARNSYIQKTLKAKKIERIKLINKGLKAFPSSKIQKDIQKKITLIENKIKSLEKEYRQNGIVLKEIDRKKPVVKKAKQIKLF